jgi:hypothetical protein
MHAHTKATMNTLVFPCMCNVFKQATHHIMTVTSIHLCPCDVVVNGFIIIVPFLTHPHKGQCDKYKRNENNLKDILPNFDMNALKTLDVGFRRL